MSTNQNGVFIRSQHDLKKELRITKPISLNHVCVSNGEMLAAISANAVLHASVAHTQHTTEKPAEMTLPILSTDTISNVHLSPSGRHGLVSTRAGDNFYINVKSNAFYAVRKIKGTITAVGWNPDMGVSDTGHILLGTSKGGILETSIASSGTVSFVKEHTACLGEKDMAVAGLSLHLITDEEPKTSRWTLFICQPDRLFALTATVDMTPRAPSYVGSSSLQAGWVVLPEQQLHIFHPFFAQKELFYLRAHSGWSAAATSFCLFPDSREPGHFKFLWLTADGYTTGTVNLAAESNRELIEEDRHVEHERVEGAVECPLAVSLTEYHILLLYPSRLKAVSFYTHNVVYDDAWPKELGVGVGLAFDSAPQYHWLYTTSCVLKYRPNDEARYVWKVFMETGDYSRALAVARDRKAIEPQAYELVLSRQADKYIAEKNFGAAAEILAQSTEAFETVVLRFLSAEDKSRTGLKTLLDKKLEQFIKHEDRIKRDALFMWLLEIQLSDLSELRKQDPATAENRDAEGKLKELNRQLHALLRRNNVQDTIACLKDAIYRLMVSHADFDSQLFVATQLKDHDTIIKIRLSREQYVEALNLIVQLDSADLFYKHASVLAERIPREVFASLDRLPTVRPNKLLPLLCQTQTEAMAVHTIAYLEKVISKAGAASGESLHNLLISLYARFRPEKLLPYLEKEGREKVGLPYDLEYAIRTSQQYGLTRCTIHLYCVEGMFTEAVEMALTNMKDVQLAMDCVRWMHPGNEELFTTTEDGPRLQARKVLWLRIARYLMEEGGGDAAACIGLLKKSEDAIKIQDIFPLFPDFTKIEHVKEPLVKCLEEHSRKIQNLQKDMQNATQVLHEIRERTEKLKKRVTTVRPSDVCSRCRQTLCTRPYFAHACKHLFHRDCLEKEMAPYLSQDEKRRLGELVGRERKLLAELEYLDRQSEKAAAHAEKESLAASLNMQIAEIVGCECPLCSTLAIEYVDRPFFTDDEFKQEMEDWAI